MCLSKITHKFEHNNEIILTGYKRLLYHQGMNMWRAVFRSGSFLCDRWVRADIRLIQSHLHDLEYESGFHAYSTPETERITYGWNWGVSQYNQSWHETNLIPVKLRNIICFGDQEGDSKPTIVAREIAVESHVIKAHFEEMERLKQEQYAQSLESWGRWGEEVRNIQAKHFRSWDINWADAYKKVDAKPTDRVPVASKPTSNIAV